MASFQYRNPKNKKIVSVEQQQKILITFNTITLHSKIIPGSFQTVAVFSVSQ